MQACDEAGAQAGTHRGVRGCAEGGVYQVENQSQEGEEACCEKVVLRALRGVWPGINITFQHQEKFTQNRPIQIATQEV